MGILLEKILMQLLGAYLNFPSYWHPLLPPPPPYPYYSVNFEKKENKVIESFIHKIFTYFLSMAV